MDLKLWKYIFEMFNYKIRQKKSIFFKITNPYPALKLVTLKMYENLSTFLTHFHFLFIFTGFFGEHKLIMNCSK